MYLLVLHFVKPEEKHKTEIVKDIPAIVFEIFHKDSPTSFERINSMPSLQALYSLKETNRYEFLEIVRKSLVELISVQFGMETYMFRSRDDDEVFCKISCPEEILLHEAHRTHYELALNEVVILTQYETNQLTKDLLPYAPFDEQKFKENPNLFEIYEDDSILRNVDRIRLIESIIKGNISNYYLDIHTLIQYGVVIDLFPLHEKKTLDKLKTRLLNYFSLSTYVPVDTMRNYFGEKLSYYFLW